MIRDLIRHRNLVWNLTARELKIRYRGSLLGFLWTVLIPLFMAAIYIFFLRLMAGRGIPTADIVIGVFAWQYTAQCVTSGLTSITGSANLVKKVALPRVILPFSATLANFIGYLLTFVVQIPVIAFLMIRSGQAPSAWVLAIPAVMAVHFAFNLALAMLTGAINVYFRDLQHLVGVALSAWFFVTPVMYNMDFVAQTAGQFPGLTELFMLNPMAAIITAYRAGAGTATFPVTGCALASFAASFLLLWLAARVFKRLQKDFADYL